MIFHNKTLRKMVACRPTAREEMLDIAGVRQSNLVRFGDRFLEVINRSKDESAGG